RRHATSDPARRGGNGRIINETATIHGEGNLFRQIRFRHGEFPTPQNGTAQERFLKTKFQEFLKTLQIHYDSACEPGYDDFGFGSVASKKFEHFFSNLSKLAE